MNAPEIVTLLTPVIVPLVLAGVKRFLPMLPSWTIPVLAPILGVGVDLINQIATQHAGNLLVGALLGLAGVGLREVKEAVKPAPNGGWPADAQ